MTRTPINRDAARAILGRDIMDEATLHTFADNSQVYIRPITPADVATAQKWAVKKGAPNDVDQTRMALGVAMQVVVDDLGKPLYTLSDMEALLKSSRGQEMVVLAGRLLNAGAEAGNESQGLTEQEPAPL